MMIIDETIEGFNSENISEERKKVLDELVKAIQKSIDTFQRVHLNFICTHNSRRSIMAQIWAHTAASHYGIVSEMFSSGMEPTMIYPGTKKALETLGFLIFKLENTRDNYLVKFHNYNSSFMVHSKRLDHLTLPNRYIAVMTCSDADKNCPLTFRATAKVSLPYEDPKIYDNTEEEDSRYLERAYQIGEEMFYVFSKVKKME
ncbi:MAG: protein-tyrosine-phosphatase [Chitinophagales bacterium]